MFTGLKNLSRQLTDKNNSGMTLDHKRFILGRKIYRQANQSSQPVMTKEGFVKPTKKRINLSERVFVALYLHLEKMGISYQESERDKAREKCTPKIGVMFV